MFKIDESVRLIMIQFSFCNTKAVPLFALRLKQRETPLQSALRDIRRNGVQIIEPTTHVSLAQLLDGLTEAQYALVDATYQNRIGGHDQSGTYNMVRFEFAHITGAQIISLEFNRKWDDAIAGFRDMCESAMWRVRAFNNPFFQGNEEITGKRSLSLNMESREPLVDPQGQPIMIWEKDDQRRRTTKKIPLAPLHSLRISDGNLELISQVARSMTV